MNIYEIIQKIAPIQKKYKIAIKEGIPREAIEHMWEIGDILNDYLKENKIAPHKLYREIYGKGEGTKNITQKSYIPREFQSRCLRVRKYL